MNIANNIEHWALIDGYDNYEVSSFGRVRNNNTNKILKPGIVRGGYHQYKLLSKSLYVHRLVATVFCDNVNNLKEVDHIDRNTSNNHFINLRWVSPSINSKNKNTYKNNTSGYKGIYFKKSNNKWSARWNDSNKRCEKLFDNKEDAITHRKLMEQQNNYM